MRWLLASLLVLFYGCSARGCMGRLAPDAPTSQVVVSPSDPISPLINIANYGLWIGGIGLILAVAVGVIFQRPKTTITIALSSAGAIGASLAILWIGPHWRWVLGGSGVGVLVIAIYLFARNRIGIITAAEQALQRWFGVKIDLPGNDDGGDK